MSDFGGKLRLARERRGVSLRQIAATTKISVAALEALERNDVSKLPGGIFSRSFVRAYAIEVGLEPDETVHEFLERFQGAPVSAVAAHASADPEIEFQHQQHVASLVLKLLLIGIPLIVLVLYFTMRTRVGAPVSATSPAPGGLEAATRPPAQSIRPVPAPDAVPPPHSNAPVATAGAAGTASGSMTLEFSTAAACWVRLIVDGQQVLSRTMVAGEKEARPVHGKVRIDVGNAGAFTFSIDGRPGKPLGNSGEVRTVTLTRETASQYLQ